MNLLYGESRIRIPFIGWVVRTTVRSQGAKGIYNSSDLSADPFALRHLFWHSRLLVPPPRRGPICSDFPIFFNSMSIMANQSYLLTAYFGLATDDLGLFYWMTRPRWWIIMSTIFHSPLKKVRAGAEYVSHISPVSEMSMHRLLCSQRHERN